MENNVEKKNTGYKIAIIILSIAVIILIAINIYTNVIFNENVEDVLVGNQIEKNSSVTENTVVITANENSPKGNELSIADFKIENEKILIKYFLSTKNEETKKEDLTEYAIYNYPRLEIDNNIYTFFEYNAESINKIDDEKYEIYCLYDVKNIDLSKDIKFLSEFTIIKYDEETDEETIYGSWNIEQIITDEMKKEGSEAYEISDEIDIYTTDNKTKEQTSGNVRLLRIRELEDNIILSVILNSYTTEPGVKYSLDIFDKNGENLLVGKQRLIGGMVSEIILNKFDIDSEVTIKLTEDYDFTEDIDSEGERSVILSESLEKVKEIEKNIVTDEWRGLSYKYNSNKFSIVPNVSDAYPDNDNPNNINYHQSIQINDKIGNCDTITGHVSFSKRPNILNYSLDEFYETSLKLEEFGIMQRPDTTYTIFRSNGEDEETEYNFTNEEILSIYDGDEVEINGEIINREFFRDYDSLIKYENKEKVKFAGQDAITYIRDNGDTERYYIFLVDDMVYEISIPLRIGTYEESKEIIDSIELVEE